MTASDHRQPYVWALLGLTAGLLSCAAARAASLPLEPRIATVPSWSALDQREVPTATAAPASLQALEALAGGDAELAIVQEDHAQWFVGRLAGEGGKPPFEVVRELYYRYLLVLVRRPLHVEAVRDLPHLRLDVGPDEDARRSVCRLLDRAGVAPHRLGGDVCAVGAQSPAAPPSVAELRRRLADGELDVALVFASVLEADVEALRDDPDVELVSLDYRTMRLLTAGDVEESPVRPATLPRREQDGEVRTEVRTLAVPVSLLRGSGVDLRQAEEVAEKLAKELDAGFEDDEWPLVPRDGGVGRTLPYVALVVALLASGLLFLTRSRLPAVRRLRRHLPLLASVFAFPAAVLVVTLVTYLAEHRFNEHFSHPAESFWSIIVYLFSGLEDRVPYTTTGRAAAALGLILGPLLFTVVTGWVASRFIRWERKMPKNLSDHFLLINWNARGLQAVRQIHHPVITANQGTSVIVVLSDDLDLQRRLKEEGMGEDELFEDLYVTLGDPTQERALLNANAQDAHTVLLLADEQQGANADERTVRTLFVLRKIALDHGRRDLHVVVELVDQANQTICDQMAPDFPGLLECVASGEIRSCLLAQATLNRGVVQFYKDLLTVSAESNEIYSLPIPRQAVGMSFADYASLVLRSNREEPIIPVGVQREEGGRRRLACNPRPGCSEAVLASGDLLVVLAYEPPRADDLPVPSAVAAG